MHPGSAEGQLVGGNLCLISAGLGTEYELDTEGKILFLEDVHGDVGETERNISHLILAGTIQKAKGLLLGQFTDISNVNDPSYTTIDCFRELLADVPIPIMYGLESGHDFPMMTLPLGADCRMDTETREIIFNW